MLIQRLDNDYSESVAPFCHCSCIATSNKYIQLDTTFKHSQISYPDSKVHGANMEPIWGRQDPDGPHVGPMNFAI